MKETLKRNLRFLLSAFIVILTVFFALAYEASALVLPSDPAAKIPAHIIAARQPESGYGRMISPVVAFSPFGPLYALGDGVGSATLQDYIKTNSTVNLMVIVVDFSDVKISSGGRAEIASMVSDLASYFRDQSVNKINIVPTLSAKTYTMAGTMASYGATDNAGQLVRDSVSMSDSDINFTNYQCVMVAHAGAGNETTGVSDDIWSKYWYRTSGSGNLITTGDGVGINGAIIVPEKEDGSKKALGVICHEFGHQLGLPDLYDTDYNTEGGLGDWALMATGYYGGSPSGSKPAFIDPWCRQKLGWAVIENITENKQNFTFDFAKTYRMQKGGAASGNDYFLIEKRGLISGGWDSGLPGEGLLIFHVNAAKESTDDPNNTTPRLIELMVASGGNHLSSGPPRSEIRGLDSDPYPTASNKNFHNASTPSSKTSSNLNSFVGIREIVKSGTGSSLAVTAGALLVKPVLTAVSGNEQSAAVNAQFTLPVKVNLAESSGPIGANSVAFSVSSGSASIVGLSSVNTDALGFAQVNIKAGSTAGAVVITASSTVSGWDAPVTTSFTLNVTAAPSGPMLLSSSYQDVGYDGVSAGDKITLVFDSAIIISGVVPADFTLPVSGDSLGLSPSFTMGSVQTQLIITLGSSSKITAAGVFSTSSLSPGSPSGINLSSSITSGHITGTAGDARPAAAAVDIAAPVGAGPMLVAATLTDVNSNGVGAGDKITLVFDRAISISGVISTDFTLPVTGDSFGGAPSFLADSDPLKLIITLGTSPKITASGAFNSTLLTAGSPSGINISSSIAAGHIIDGSGNDARASAAALDIALVTEIGDVSISKSTYSIKNIGEQPFIADGSDTVAIEVSIFDENNNAIPNCDVYLTSDKNQYANIDLFSPSIPAKTDSSGRATILIKTVQAGIRNISVEAQKTGNIRKTLGSLQIEFKGGDVSPSLSSMSATRTLVLADGVDSAEITISLRDANQNPAIQKIVALNAAPAASILITPATALSDAGGNAKFIIKSTQPATNVVVSAVTGGGVAIDAKITFNFMSQSVSTADSKVEESTPGAAYIANGQLYAQLIITLKNSSGLPIPNVTPVVSVSGQNNTMKNADGLLMPAASVKPTNYEGKTYFQIASTTAEQKKVIVKVDGIALNQQPSLNFCSGPYSKIEYATGGSQLGTITEKLPRQLKVRVLDAFNNGVAGQKVKYTITQAPAGAEGQSVITPEPVSDTSGYASTEFKLGSKIGMYKVIAELAGASGSPIVFNLEAGSGAPSSMSISEGNNQNAPVFVPLNSPLAVKVFDVQGNPSSGVVVHFRQTAKPADASDCQLTVFDVPTDSEGAARTIVQRIGDKVGTYKIMASVSSPAMSKEFTITAVAGTPASIEILSGNSQIVTAGTLAAAQLKVRVRDNSGNNVSSPVPGCTVQLSVYKGTGTLDTESVQTDSNGEAVARYTAGKTVGQEYVWASVEGGYAVSPAQFLFNVTAGAPSAIKNGDYFNVLSARVQSPVATPFSARVVDIYGNPASNAQVNFTINTTGNTSGAVGHSILKLEPSTSKTDIYGLVKCYITAGTKAGTYEVSASAAGLSGSPVKYYAVASSGSISTEKTILSVSGTNGVTADASASIEVSLVCKDDYGNPVKGAYAYFYAEANNLMISQPVNPTGDSGIAKAYVRSNKSGSYKLSASVNGVSAIEAVTLNFSCAALKAENSLYYIHQAPAKVIANGSDFYNVKIELRDAFNNPVPGITPSSVSILNGDPLNVTIDAPIQNSDTYGVMIFKVSARQQGVKTAEVMIDGSRIKTSDHKDYIELAFLTNPIDVSKSSFEADGNVNAVADALSELKLKILARDASNVSVSGIMPAAFGFKAKNLKTGVYETVQVSPSAYFYNDADGSYNFIVKSSRALHIQFEATLTSDASVYKISGNPALNFTPGPAVSLLKTNTSDIYSKVAEKSLSILTVKAVDNYNNPVSSTPVIFSMLSAPDGALNMNIEKGGVTLYTDDNGLATTAVTLGTKTGLYTLRAESFGLNGSPVIFNAYATPGAASRYELRNVPLEVVCAQPVKQIEIAVYDAYNNLKYDCADSIYLTSTDKNAILPYNSISSPYVFSPLDNGRKVLSEGIVFLTESLNTVLTIKRVTSVSPLEISSPPVKVAKNNSQSSANFYAGSFFVPGSSNYIVVVVKSKAALAEPPTVSISFDAAAPEQYQTSSTSKARVYYKVIKRASKPGSCDMKIFGQKAVTMEYFLSETSIVY